MKEVMKDGRKDGGKKQGRKEEGGCREKGRREGRKGRRKEGGVKEGLGGTYKGGVGQSHDSCCHLGREDDEDDAEELHGDKEPSG